MSFVEPGGAVKEVVQKPGDIEEMKELIGDNKLKVMAKLEKPSAVLDYLEPIVALCDGLMVARGGTT